MIDNLFKSIFKFDILDVYFLRIFSKYKFIVNIESFPIISEVIYKFMNLLFRGIEFILCFFHEQLIYIKLNIR
jgi:hypothetical protein